MGQQDIGDLETIRVAIEVWLRHRFPDRVGLSVANLNFPEASGESSVTLILEVCWPDRSDHREERFVFRMAPRESQVFENHDLQMQFEMMSIMAKEGVPAPELIGYEPDSSLVGSDFYIMAFCEGKIPSDNPPMMLGGWLKDEATPEERAQMWSGGLGAIAKIHQIKTDAYDFSRLPQAEPGEPILAQEIRTFDSMFKPELRESVDPTILEGWEYLKATIPTDGEKALCWGDSRVGNVIFRDASPVAVIDWEMANLSDPRTDLAWWIWIDRCNSEGLGAERLPGIPEPQDVYQRWSDLTGRSVDGIEWFELFAVVRYSIILARKFAALRETTPDLDVPIFPAQYIPGLMGAVRVARGGS